MTARFSIYRKDDYISANYSNQDDAAAACTSCMCVRTLGCWPDGGSKANPAGAEHIPSCICLRHFLFHAPYTFFSTRHTRVWVLTDHGPTLFAVQLDSYIV